MPEGALIPLLLRPLPRQDENLTNIKNNPDDGRFSPPPSSVSPLFLHPRKEA